MSTVVSKNRDKQRLAEQQRGTAILREQLAERERERQRQAAEDLRGQLTPSKSLCGATAQLLQRLGPELSQAARLVFVVPPGVFDSFTWQPWQTAKGEVLASEYPILKPVQQWVMELKVQPSPRGSSSSGGTGSSAPNSRSGSGGGAAPV